MIWLTVATGLFLVWFARRKLFTPWGKYVSHTETKSGNLFMTVRHVSWIPPFLDKDVVWHNSQFRPWFSEVTARPADGPNILIDRGGELDALLALARARKEELDEAML